MGQTSTLRFYQKWIQLRNAQFLNCLEYSPRANVVDLGCGKGDFTLQIKEKIGCSEIHGIDVWKDGLKEAKKRGVKVLGMDLNESLELPTESFDIVVSNQVIEHIIKLRKFVSEIYRILKVGGYAVISTENLSSWDNILAILLGRTPFSVVHNGLKCGNRFSPHNKELYKGQPSHVRIFAYHGLLEFFKYFCFKIETIKTSGYLPFNVLSRIDPIHARFITIKARK